MAAITSTTVEERLLLRSITWQTYLELRQAGDNRNIRMTYDQGLLEMMAPSRLHERLGYLIGRLIDIWTMELNIPIEGCRSTTFRRQDLQRGLEADNCYYVKSEPLVREREELDLSIDPPPDLAVEIDITSNSLDKMPIYAALGVPEVWRYDGSTLRVFQLNDGRYDEVQSSASFPSLPLAVVMQFLDCRHEMDETSWILAFRKWIRETVRPAGS